MKKFEKHWYRQCEKFCLKIHTSFLVGFDILSQFNIGRNGERQELAQVRGSSLHQIAYRIRDGSLVQIPTR